MHRIPIKRPLRRVHTGTLLRHVPMLQKPKVSLHLMNVVASGSRCSLSPHFFDARGGIIWLEKSELEPARLGPWFGSSFFHEPISPARQSCEKCSSSGGFSGLIALQMNTKLERQIPPQKRSWLDSARKSQQASELELEDSPARDTPT